MSTYVVNPQEAEGKAFKYLNVLAMIWISVLVVSAFTSIKTFDFGPFVFSVAVILYPVSYIFVNLFTEVYGYQNTRRIVWTGLVCLVLTSAIAYLYALVPPDDSFKEQKAYELIFKATPIVFLGYIIAFFAGEFLNSYVIAKLKVLTKGKHLWARYVSSTFLGQSADNTIAYTWACFLGGYFAAAELPNLIISTVLFCTAWEIVAIPITKRVTNFLKDAEGLDVYDYHTDFNPFRVK